MPAETTEQTHVLRTAAWIWVSYLAALACIDALIYAGRPAVPVLWYHAVNALPALLFLGLSYSQWAKSRTAALVPWMVLLISIGPLLLNHLVDMRLPAAPLSNLEGMVLRQLPVLFIGLVLVAWHYNLATMVIYSIGVNLFELAVIRWFGPFDPERLNVFYFITIIRTVSFIVVGIFINQLIAVLRSQQEALRAQHVVLREQQEYLRRANAELTHYASTLENLAVSRERNRLARRAA